MTIEIKPQKVDIEINASTMGVSLGHQAVREFMERDPYTGSYEITPSAEAQTLATSGKRMTADLIINPVPSNYGLITWNGAYLTVS